MHVLTRCPISTGVECIVVTPEQPAFRFRLPERWLAATPPAPRAGAAPGPVRLPLAAVDSLTQRLLGLQRAEAAHAHPHARDPAPDLDAAAPAQPATPGEPAGGPAAPGSERSER